MQKSFEKMSDEQILEEIRAGSKEAMECLLRKYLKLIKKTVRRYYLIGGDEEDLLQEGYIGLIKAIQTFDREKTDCFYPFAKLCMERQLCTAVTASNRKKHQPLNHSVSMDAANYLELESQKDNPEKIVLAKEMEEDLYRDIREKLSSLEQKVILLYLKGMSFAEIAVELNKSEKSIDNAIWRAKKKLREMPL
jgi:RNA polymerase sporulation-specific sigma factor